MCQGIGFKIKSPHQAYILMVEKGIQQLNTQLHNNKD